ncbi:hypothetical protein C0585_02150 [Candidatus Woesearchaeota archaeon]|nr:MAG: hypothetical protein C0585_02150 [Candidatus Woesearchaeota archaeon]
MRDLHKNIHWDLVKKTTISSYILLIIFLPLNPIWSTVLLFSIVAIWSRLPGMATPHIGDWILMLDLVDFFSMIIAINIGGVEAAIFSIIVNIGSKIMGEHGNWLLAIKDMIAVALTCMMIPYVHLITSNIQITMALFTVIRNLWFIPMQVLMPAVSWGKFWMLRIVWSSGLFVINNLYSRFFGEFFDGLLKTGVNFSWSLFLLVTSVLVGVGIYKKYFKKTTINQTNNTTQNMNTNNAYKMC